MFPIVTLHILRRLPVYKWIGLVLKYFLGEWIPALASWRLEEYLFSSVALNSGFEFYDIASSTYVFGKSTFHAKSSLKVYAKYTKRAGHDCFSPEGATWGFGMTFYFEWMA